MTPGPSPATMPTAPSTTLPIVGVGRGSFAERQGAATVRPDAGTARAAATPPAPATSPGAATLTAASWPALGPGARVGPTIPAGPTGPADPAPDPLEHQLAEVLLPAARTGGTTALTLQLHPSTMGQVAVEVHVTGDRVDVRFSSGDAATRQALSDGLEALRSTMDGAGLSTGTLDVGSWDLSGQQRRPGEGGDPTERPAGPAPQPSPVAVTDAAAPRPAQMGRRSTSDPSLDVRL